MNNNPKNFDFHELPSAYLTNNPKADELRKQVIQNQVRINEQNQGSDETNQVSSRVGKIISSQGQLEELFFSDENMDLINKQLILSVFKRTKGEYKISEQSKENLLIVMRYIFIEYARHLPYNITEQIRELNCRVVGELVPTIVTNVSQKLAYLKEISEPRKINNLPRNVNIGRK